MTPEPSERDPWVETPEGSLFFVNALLVIPEMVVLLPLGLGTLLRGAGVVQGASPVLDPIPVIAEAALPWVGWLLVVPVWTTLKNLKMVGPGPARVALTVFLAIHVGFLTYTVLRWTGTVGP